MNRTKIEWVKNPDGSPGYTWNPITGCLNHDNGLCKGGGFPCYAYRLANGRLKPLYLANDNLTPCSHGSRDSICVTQDDLADPFYPRFWEDRVREDFGSCYAGAAPKGIFVCDMGDLFGIGVPEAWTRRILSHIGMAWYREHRFYLLTKQPQNLIKWSPFPENCYVGVTATTFEHFGIAGIYLPDIKAPVKFISFEPLLERITDTKQQYNPGMMAMDLKFAGITWLIIGAQTNPYKPPEIEDLREIVEAADKAGVKVFLKDNLMPLFKRGDIWAIPEWASFNDWSKQDIGTTLRQEVPK